MNTEIFSLDKIKRLSEEARNNPEDNAPKAIASFPRTILFDIICHYVLNFKNLVM
jgi:hypothetical protein